MEGRALSLAVPPALQRLEGAATFLTSHGWLYALPLAWTSRASSNWL